MFEVGFFKNIFFFSEFELVCCSVFFMWFFMFLVYLVGKLNVLYVYVY